jgi:hypothetical protein
MHDLITLDALSPGALTVAEIDATMAYAEAEKAVATRRAYASDWHQFAVWCHARAATPLPAHQGIVAAYLSHLADTGRKARSVLGTSEGFRAGRCTISRADRLPGVW